MCKKCVTLMRKYLPDLSEEEQIDVLYDLTCFPMCPPEDLEEQLIELVKRYKFKTRYNNAPNHPTNA